MSEELGTDGPSETFGHPDESRVGHLVEEDEGCASDETPETIAHDSHDVEDLAAEELAMHYVEEDSEQPVDDDDLPEYLRASLVRVGPHSARTPRRTSARSLNLRSVAGLHAGRGGSPCGSAGALPPDLGRMAG